MGVPTTREGKGGDLIPTLSKEINFRLYAISHIGNDVRNECNEVSPILMTEQLVCSSMMVAAQVVK